MSDNVRRIWAIANSTLLCFVLIFLAIWPERFFVIGPERRPIEIFVLLVIVSSATFLLVLFISSFMTIHRSTKCHGNTIFELIGSMLSLLFMMAVKVLADEIGHELNMAAETVSQHGEFWIMLAFLVLVLGFMAFVGLKKESY